MASATKTTKQVEVKQYVDKQTGVSLILSNEEAVALLIVLNHVGGSPNSTPRGIVGNIKQALDKHYSDVLHYGRDTSNSQLYFKDGSITQVKNYVRDKKLT